ncbi:MAG: cobalamin B12-binding domain-containing protein [Planctomycetota bacterium]|jgi:methanogenic corrinoid protein MtbC1
MIADGILERYLDALLEGNRKRCRIVIEEALQSGIPANSVCADIIWPIMLEIEQLLRSDRITAVQEHMATRINRTIVDQLQNKLPRRPERSKKIVVCCAPEELQELGAQITADFFESDGWETRFLGGGLTNDDILGYTNEHAPDILLIYGTAPRQAPDVRRLIDTVRSVNAWPDMKIMLSGGVFNRAEGLWEEIGADLFAETAVKAVQIASENRPIEPRARSFNNFLMIRRPPRENIVAEAALQG